MRGGGSLEKITNKTYNTTKSFIKELDLVLNEKSDDKVVNPDTNSFIDKFRKYSSAFNNKYISSLGYKYITNLNFSPYFCTYDLETFKSYYFSEALKAAESLGCTIELIEAWEFQKSYDLFKEFVEPLYELKRVGNKDERDVFKLCLNTLYGKWGQHRIYRVNIITGDKNLMENIEKTFSNIRQTTIDENIASYSFDKAPNPNLLKDNPELFNKLSETFKKSIESRVSI